MKKDNYKIYRPRIQFLKDDPFDDPIIQYLEKYKPAFICDCLRLILVGMAIHTPQGGTPGEVITNLSRSIVEQADVQQNYHEDRVADANYPDF